MKRTLLLLWTKLFWENQLSLEKIIFYHRLQPKVKIFYLDRLDQECLLSGNAQQLVDYYYLELRKELRDLR